MVGTLMFVTFYVYQYLSIFASFTNIVFVHDYYGSLLSSFLLALYVDIGQILNALLHALLIVDDALSW